MAVADGVRAGDPSKATVSQVRAATKRPANEFILNRYYGTIVSPYFTALCLRLGMSADQVTIAGGTVGLIGVALLFPPLGVWSLVGVVALQLGYILDFSDGQVARVRSTSSVAGGYLDWLTHLYVPPAAALATAASVSATLGQTWPFALGILAALELAALAFQAKEHILISLARTNPAVAFTRFYFAALNDDARASDVTAAREGPPEALASEAVLGRVRPQSLRSVAGEVLIYPGAVHLLFLAVAGDAILAAAGGPSCAARTLVLATWSAALCVHVPATIRRNYRLIRAVETRYRHASRSESDR